MKSKMKKLLSKIIYFFHKQEFVIVSTLDSRGGIHCSAKGIVGIEEEGKIYIIDLYKAQTLANLKNNPVVTITAVDVSSFEGYSLKGIAKIVDRVQIKEHIIKKWEERVINRISGRVVKDIKKDKRSLIHPEACFPRPEYMIEMEVQEIVDLRPAHLTQRME